MSKILSLSNEVVKILDDKKELLENEREEDVSYSQVVKEIMKSAGIWRSNKIVAKKRLSTKIMRGKTGYKNQKL